MTGGAAETMVGIPVDSGHIMATFGDWLRSKRAARGLSQRALADRSGLSAAMVARLESDTVGFSQDTLRMLAEGLLHDGGDIDALYREVRAASVGLIDDMAHQLPGEQEVVAAYRSADEPEREQILRVVRALLGASG